MAEHASQPRPTLLNSWLDGLLAAAVIGLAVVLGGAVVRNSQVWMHLATGRALADGSAQFGSDPFSYATEGRAWHHTAWLFDLLLYKLYSIGDATVVGLRVAAIVAAAGLMLLVRKPQSSLAWPAVGAAVALVAVNSRLPIFQSTFISYAMLALLVWLLHANPRWMPLGVGLACALWANLDAWFILGPLTVALWLVGSLVQPIGATPAKTLALALLASLVGCLINPHHVRAFAVPDELAPTFFAPEVKTEPALRSLLVGPFSLSDGAGQWYSERLGAAPTTAFYLLLAVGLASFAANFPARPWGRLVVWLAFAVLASWRYRLVPFFAVVGTPLVVLNLQELGRYWPTTAAGRTFGALLRLFGVALLTLLGFAAFPGWLGPRADDPQKAARFGLRVVPDAAMERMARQVAEWVRDGRLTANDRGFAPSLDFGPYLAWFGPPRQSFTDARWGLFEPEMADFLLLSKALNRLGRPGDGEAPADLRGLEETLRRRGITYVVLESLPTAQALWSFPKQWQFRALAGRLTAFGYVDGRNPSRGQADWGLNPASLAFAPQNASSLKPPQDPDLLIPSAWDAYCFGPPAVPLEQAESKAWARYFETLEFLATEERTRTSISLLGLPGLGSAPWATVVGPGVAFATDAEVARRWFTPERLGAGVMCLRSARAAYCADPRDSESLLFLASAYKLPPSTSRLVRVQSMTALKQAEIRLPILAAWGYNPKSVEYGVADMLATYYREGKQLDLCVAALKAAVQAMPYSGLPTEYARAKHAYDTKNLMQWEKELQERRDKYELEAERSPANRIGIALMYGLHAEALVVARGSGAAIDPVDRLNLMLEAGLGEEAYEELRGLAMDTVPEQRRLPLRMLRLFAAAATAHNAEALDHIAEVLTEYQSAREQMTKSGPGHAAQIAAQLVAADALAAPVLVRAVTVPLMSGRLVALRRQADLRMGEFEMLLCRGLLALQLSDTRLARRAFDDALSLSPQNAPFPGADLAKMYRDVLVKYDR